MQEFSTKMMKEVNFDGYRFLQINKGQNFFSIKGKNNFCSLDSWEKKTFLKLTFK